MNRLARLFVNELNYHGLLDGSNAVFGTDVSLTDDSQKLVYDWKSIGITVTQSGTRSMFSADMVVFREDTVGGETEVILKNPADRLKEAPFFCEDVQHIVRCIVDQGYLFMRVEGLETFELGKSGFHAIIEECVLLHERLLQCSRYSLANKKKAAKLIYLKQLGYLSETGE